MWNNDLLDADFITPYNLPLSTPSAPKQDLISQIDAAKEADDTPAANTMLKCSDVWYVNLLSRNPQSSRSNPLPGTGWPSAPRRGTLNSTWMPSAPICRRRPSATAPGLWSARRTFVRSSRSISARTSRRPTESIRLPSSSRSRSNKSNNNNQLNPVNVQSRHRRRLPRRCLLSLRLLGVYYNNKHMGCVWNGHD